MSRPRKIDRDRIIALYNAGASYTEIATELNTSVAYLLQLLDASPRPPRTNLAAVDTSGARCRCGLRLPCNNCLPASAADMCRGPGQTLPSTPAREDWIEISAAYNRTFPNGR